jgi:hypothetical protein
MSSTANLHERHDALPPSIHPSRHTPSPFPSSTAALSDPLHFEAMRTATSVLCKHLPRQPVGLDERQFSEVKRRMRPLRQLEILWWGNDASTNPLGASGSEADLGTTILGEERAQRMFSKALRDGYVLCQ